MDENSPVEIIEHYKEAIDAFCKGKLWENAISTYRTLKDFYPDNHQKYIDFLKIYRNFTELTENFFTNYIEFDLTIVVD